jgi:hypothetical protein
MYRRIGTTLVLVGLVATAALAVPSSPQPERVTDPTAKERAALAEQVYRDTIDRTGDMITAPPVNAGDRNSYTRILNAELAERLGQWSTRWRDAQFATAETPAARVAALSAHRDRMVHLADFSFLAEAAGFKERKNQIPRPADVKDLGLADFANSARFLLLESEARLAREKGR